MVLERVKVGLEPILRMRLLASADQRHLAARPRISTGDPPLEEIRRDKLRSREEIARDHSIGSSASLQ